jgi:thiol-disulfide isomerase/thioredoxin
MRILYVFGLILLLCISGSLMAFRPLKGINSSFEMPDVSLRDTSGKLINLSSISGKIIYYDFWASWCSPCMSLMEPTRKLQESVATDDVTWVFISFDKDLQAWKKAVKSNNLKGVQLLASPDDISIFKDQLSIYSIPFIIWADGSNHIIKYDAPRPTQGINEKLMKFVDRQGNSKLVKTN